MIYDLVVIDTKLMAYSQFHRKLPITEFLNIVMRALVFNNIKYKKLGFAWDVHKSRHRLEWFPGYKGGRKKAQDKDHHEDQTRRDLFIKDYKKLPTILSYIGINFNETIGMEADDVPNIIHQLDPELNILCMSMDFDWLYNIKESNNKIDVLRFAVNKLLTSENIDDFSIAKYELPIKEVFELSLIAGQKKDSIPGVNGVGPKRWKKYMLDLDTQGRYELVQDWLTKGTFKASFHTEGPDNIADLVDLTTKLMSFLSIKDLEVEEVEQFTKALSGDKVPEQLSYQDWVSLSLLELEEVPPLDEATYNALQRSIQKER